MATRFGGRFNAVDFAYGLGGTSAPPYPLTVNVGNAAAGVTALQLAYGYSVTGDGIQFLPLATNAPVLFGEGANGETLTPSAVSSGAPTVQGATTVTANFANLHGIGDQLASGTAGLQEAINYVASIGGGMVVIDSKWVMLGGTAAMLAAASLPAGNTVMIEDVRGPVTQWWENRGTSAVIAAPTIALVSQVASLTGVTGTWTAATVHVRFTYVTADGGETLPSPDFTFTATVSLAIGGSGPVAATDAVGYRVYIGSGATGWNLVPTAASGTPIQCGAITAFKIGTSFVSTTVATNATATIPLVSTAFGTVKLTASLQPSMGFKRAYQAFPDAGTIGAGTTKTLGVVQLPTGFLNQPLRSIRIKGTVVSTTNAATGTLTVAINLHSNYGVTSVPLFTAVSGTTTSAAVINCDFSVVLTVASTGATGTVEAHGTVFYNLAGTAVASPAMDIIAAVGSAIDLTKQDAIDVTLTAATIAPTANVLRNLVIEMLA